MARLRYDGPRSVMTPALLADLRRHKGRSTPGPSDGDDGIGIFLRAPVTTQQSGMIQAHHAQPCPQALDVPLLITLDGRLDHAALKAALGELVTRHFALRCRLVRDGEGWRQEILVRPTLRVPLENLTGLSGRTARPHRPGSQPAGKHTP